MNGQQPDRNVWWDDLKRYGAVIGMTMADTEGFILTRGVPEYSGAVEDQEDALNPLEGRIKEYSHTGLLLHPHE